MDPTDHNHPDNRRRRHLERRAKTLGTTVEAVIAQEEHDAARREQSIADIRARPPKGGEKVTAGNTPKWKIEEDAAKAAEAEARKAKAAAEAPPPAPVPEAVPTHKRSAIALAALAKATKEKKAVEEALAASERAAAAAEKALAEIQRLTGTLPSSLAEQDAPSEPAASPDAQPQ